MNIFMTGATGFLGRHLLRFLVRTQPDANVICLVRDPDKAKAQWNNSPPQVQWLPGDLLEPETYRNALQNVELVFHAAALVSLRNGPEFYTQNTEATRLLLESLKISGQLRRFLFVGSISAVDRAWELTATEPLTEDSPCRPNTDYGQSKLAAERLVADSGLPYTIMIPAYIYGPDPRPNSSMDRLVRDMIAGQRYTRFPFPGLASEVYVEDLAEMLWVSATHPNTLNQRYFISNPEPVRIARACQMLAEALQIPEQSYSVSPGKLERFRRLWRKAQPDSLILRILFESYFVCDPSRWYNATGFTPRFGIQQGIQKTVNWYKTQEHFKNTLENPLPRRQ